MEFVSLALGIESDHFSNNREEVENFFYIVIVLMWMHDPGIKMSLK
jgi:hypothetical protein